MKKGTVKGLAALGILGAIGGMAAAAAASSAPAKKKTDSAAPPLPEPVDIPEVVPPPVMRAPEPVPAAPPDVDEPDAPIPAPVPTPVSVQPSPADTEDDDEPPDVTPEPDEPAPKAAAKPKPPALKPIITVDQGRLINVTPPAKATPPGMDRPLARELAPKVAENVAKKKYDYDRTLVTRFQTAAGIPADRNYGPQTKSAVQYYGVRRPPKALFKGADGTLRDVPYQWAE